MSRLWQHGRGGCPVLLIDSPTDSVGEKMGGEVISNCYLCQNYDEIETLFERYIKMLAWRSAQRTIKKRYTWSFFVMYPL